MRGLSFIPAPTSKLFFHKTAHCKCKSLASAQSGSFPENGTFCERCRFFAGIADNPHMSEILDDMPDPSPDIPEIAISPSPTPSWPNNVAVTPKARSMVRSIRHQVEGGYGLTPEVRSKIMRNMATLAAIGDKRPSRRRLAMDAARIVDLRDQIDLTVEQQAVKVARLDAGQATERYEVAPAVIRRPVMPQEPLNGPS